MIFMKILFAFFCIKCEALDESLISKAIADICEVFFVKNSIYFDVIIYGGTTRHLDDVTDGVLRLIGANISKSVLNLKTVVGIQPSLEDSAVILFPNISFVQYFNRVAVLSNPSPKVLKFLIYCEGLTELYNLPAVTNYTSDISHISSFEYFVINQKSSIELIVFDHFMPKTCNLLRHRVINSFDKKSQKWIKKMKNFRNFENFNGCSLTYTDAFYNFFLLNNFNKEITECVKLSSKKDDCLNLINEILKRPNVKFQGLVYEIFETIAKRGNFNTNYKFFMNRPSTSTKRDIQFYITGYCSDCLLRTHISSTIYDISAGIFVTPSEFYNNFEKLLLPFDALTWILLFATFITITVVLFVMRFTPTKFKKFVYGHGIKTPGLNVLRIFFGIGQTKLPRESILRFILIFFVMFCLIMRTCYQSKMFDFITTDMRKPPPRTLDEVVDMGYTIVISNSSPIDNIFRDEVLNKYKR